MTPRSIHAVALATLVAVVSCSSDGIAPPTSTEQGVVVRHSDSTLLAGLIVSGPVGGASNPLDHGASSASVGESSGMAWVSLVPGTVADGVEATITNLRTTKRVTVEIVDGGFDPQQMVALLDDSLEIDVSRGGKPAAAAFIRVGPKLAPRIVRTRPPRGQTDAPLNTIITIVFSEPVYAGSVNATSVVLSTGESPLAAQVRVPTEPGYTVELTPRALLLPNTTYSLTVGGVANLAGTALDASVSITFTTSASASPESVATVLSPDSAVINPGEQIVLKATTTNLLGDSMIVPGVTWTSSAPEVASVIRGNEVVGIGPGTAVITAREPVFGVAGTVHITVKPATTPVGAIITTRCDEEGYCDGIYAVDPDGTNGRLLTVNDRDADPVWSPDGKSIAFRSRRNCDGSNLGCFFSLYIMKGDGSGIGTDGSGLRALTEGSGLEVEGISWSPDGSRLVFAAALFPNDLENRYDLYIVNADGSGLRRLVSAPTNVSLSRPDWSPDGRRIVYNVFGPDDTSAIDIVDADGSNVVRISTPPESTGDTRPRWSPDGKRIAFTRSWATVTPGVGPGMASQTLVMNADGSDVIQIRSEQSSEWFPAWSPDGASLALFSRYYGGFFVVSADGTERRPTPVLCCGYGDSSLSWRRAPAVVPAPMQSSTKP